MKYSEGRRMKILMIAGLMLAAAGALAAWLLPQEAHALTRIAGVCSGMGSSLACIGAVILFRRSRMSEAQQRARDLALGDERGVMIAYKAQNIMAIASVLMLVAVLIVATIRGDDLYRNLCTIACFVLFGVKLVAWYGYNKKM